VVICLELGADLHMVQLMPLPLTVSCFSKIQIGFTFLVPAHPRSPGQRAVKRLCVCVCVYCVSSQVRDRFALSPLSVDCRGRPCAAFTFTTPLLSGKTSCYSNGSDSPHRRGVTARRRCCMRANMTSSTKPKYATHRNGARLQPSHGPWPDTATATTPI